ncbi:MAG: PspC domain-containing protein [Ilumatobacter sp.]
MNESDDNNAQPAADDFGAEQLGDAAETGGVDSGAAEPSVDDMSIDPDDTDIQIGGDIAPDDIGAQTDGDTDSPDGIDAGDDSSVSATDVPTDAPPPPPPGPPTGPPTGAPYTPPPPGPNSSADAPGLVRDPHATFGGVLSGVAHRYGWSVAVVRLGFVALMLASFGLAVLLYLAAWVIVPRATHWPPQVVRQRGERFSNRELGLGVAGAGLVTFLVVGTGGAAAVLVPLLLVGGGVWLLAQPPREVVGAEAGGAGGAVPSFATPPPPVGEPVPPRRRRRWVVRILVAGVVLFSLGIAAIAAAFATGGFDGFELKIGDDALVVANYVPETLDDLPDSIDARVGGVRIDLTDLDLAEFDDLDSPFELDIDLRDGGVDLTLPDDLAVSIDASVRDGDIDVSDARLPGADISSSSVDLNVADPDMIITIDIGDGGINIDTER